MKVHLITIGDEILIGQIVDTNSAWMARQLNQIGATIRGITSVADRHDAILNGIQQVLPDVDIVLLTGGLGPTKDDITKQAIADLLGMPLAFHEATYERLEKFFQRIGRTPTPAHRTQCMLPAEALVLPNNMGTAPGMWFSHQGKVIVSMPGVPYEMQYLMTKEVLPRLQQQFPGRAIVHLTLRTAGDGESRIAQRLESIEAGLPEHIKLAYLPSLGQVRVRLSGMAKDGQTLQREVDHYAEQIRVQLGDLIYGQDEDDLESVLGSLLRKRGLSLATAESCTGGYIAHLITSVAGASDYFWGSIIAYDNRVKRNILQVREATLQEHGAVSEATVVEMAKGALQVLGTDLAIAVSGIAGPGGGSEEKPVGTIWMAVANRQGRVTTHRMQGGEDRMKNIQYAGSIALNLVRKFALQQGQENHS